MDCSPPGSSIHGIFQARVLEWGAIAFSKWWPDKAKWPSKITTQNTELKHTHINLAVLIRHSLTYKNTVSQKTFYRDTELQIQVLTASKISKGGKEVRLKEEGGGGGRGAQKGWPYRHLLPPEDT